MSKIIDIKIVPEFDRMGTGSNSRTPLSFLEVE